MVVIIDTDAGIDDACAILLAVNSLHSKENPVIGITTVFGNVNLHQANLNASKILEVSKNPAIPIYPGAHKPIVVSGYLLNPTEFPGHGDDGLGGHAGKIDFSHDKTEENKAVFALIENARRFKGELIVVAIGPVTNIALATLIDPNFPNNLKKLIVMGGTITGAGNITKHAEFNVGCDPEATQIVLDHFIHEKLFIVPIELCRNHPIPWEKYDNLCSSNSRLSKFVKSICKVYENYLRNNANTRFRGWIMCDTYAIAILLSENYILESKICTGKVELNLGEYRGATNWDFIIKEQIDLESNISSKLPNATLITKINQDIYESLFFNLFYEN